MVLEGPQTQDYFFMTFMEVSPERTKCLGDEKQRTSARGKMSQEFPASSVTLSLNERCRFLLIPNTKAVVESIKYEYV